jgi:transposase
MLWFMILQMVSTLVELIQLRRTSTSDKELEILLLRRQLAIYECQHHQPMWLTRGEKLTLVVLAVRLKATTGRTIKQLGDVIRIVKPKTVFGWHRELVRWKWTYRQRNRGGRPRTDRDIERLVMRLARENGWGNERIEGELLKLGYEISDETVANILRRHGIPPVPERDTSPSWRHLMTHYKDQLLACDFFHHRNFVSPNPVRPRFRAPCGGVSDCALRQHRLKKTPVRSSDLPDGETLRGP